MKQKVLRFIDIHMASFVYFITIAGLAILKALNLISMPWCAITAAIPGYFVVLGLEWLCLIVAMAIIDWLNWRKERRQHDADICRSSDDWEK